MSLFDFLGYENQTSPITLIVIFIIFAYFIKNLFLSFLAWVDSKFAFGVAARLSKDFFKGYLNLPYYFYLKGNTSKLIYNTTVSVDLYKFTLNYAAVLVSEVLVYEMSGLVCF